MMKSQQDPNGRNLTRNGEGMDETKTYIVEIPQVLGDETTIFMEADGNAVKSLFAISKSRTVTHPSWTTAIARLTKRRVRGLTQSCRNRTT
jgi:hypothetical protein